MREALFLSTGLVLLMMAGTAGCGSDIALPEPAPLGPRQQRDDWIKPGANVRLQGWMGPGVRAKTMRITNDGTFGWTLLDDVWLSVQAPNVKVRREGPYIGDGRHGWDVYLRCPAPRIIPAKTTIEISFDACGITTYEPGPGARLISCRLVAREGYLVSAIEPALEIERPPRE